MNKNNSDENVFKPSSNTYPIRNFVIFFELCYFLQPFKGPEILTFINVACSKQTIL